MIATDLPEPGGAGNQQMRHARQINDHRFAADRFAKTQRQFRRALVVVHSGQQLAQIDFLADRVGQFDPDRVAA